MDGSDLNHNHSIITRMRVEISWLLSNQTITKQEYRTLIGGKWFTLITMLIWQCVANHLLSWRRKMENNDSRNSILFLYWKTLSELKLIELTPSDRPRQNSFWIPGKLDLTSLLNSIDVNSTFDFSSKLSPFVIQKISFQSSQRKFFSALIWSLVKVVKILEKDLSFWRNQSFIKFHPYIIMKLSAMSHIYNLKRVMCDSDQTFRYFVMFCPK